MNDSFGKVANMLRDADPDVTAFAAFPAEHPKKTWSSNPVERVSTEIKRRADVVQVLPSRDFVMRLVGAVLLEQREQWQYGERHYLSEISMRRLVTQPREDPHPTALTTARNDTTRRDLTRSRPKPSPLGLNWRRRARSGAEDGSRRRWGDGRGETGSGGGGDGSREGGVRKPLTPPTPGRSGP